MPAEIEAKMKIESFDDLRGRLLTCGARRVGAVLETNTFFDTPARALLAADQGLRLRRSRDVESGQERLVITFKGPQQPGELKDRQETELEVTSADDAIRLLEVLGFGQTLSFEKKRESWTLGGCKIELDELPILDRFVEIEGPDAETVLRRRAELGLAAESLIKTGYVTMLADRLREAGDPRRRITF